MTPEEYRRVESLINLRLAFRALRATPLDAFSQDERRVLRRCTQEICNVAAAAAGRADYVIQVLAQVG